jgi:uncharacterized membrane protein
VATLTVWKLDSADGATEAAATLKRLQKQQLLQVQDAAAVNWRPDARRPTITLLHELVGAGTVGGAFWGMLFGLLFFVPLLGMAIVRSGEAASAGRAQRRAERRRHPCCRGLRFERQRIRPITDCNCIAHRLC